MATPGDRVSGPGGACRPWRRLREGTVAVVEQVQHSCYPCAHQVPPVVVSVGLPSTVCGPPITVTRRFLARQSCLTGLVVVEALRVAPATRSGACAPRLPSPTGRGAPPRPPAGRGTW